jgi:hypothetical protein
VIHLEITVCLIKSENQSRNTKDVIQLSLISVIHHPFPFTSLKLQAALFFFFVLQHYWGLNVNLGFAGQVFYCEPLLHPFFA